MNAKVFSAAALLAPVAVPREDGAPEVLVRLRGLKDSPFVRDAALPIGVFWARRMRESFCRDNACYFYAIAPARLCGTASQVRVVELLNRTTLAAADGVSDALGRTKYCEPSPHGANRKVFASLCSECALLAELVAVTSYAVLGRGEHLAALIARTFERDGGVVLQLLESDCSAPIDNWFGNNHDSAFHKVDNKIHRVVSIPHEKARYVYVGAC